MTPDEIHEEYVALVRFIKSTRRERIGRSLKSLRLDVQVSWHAQVSLWRGAIDDIAMSLDSVRFAFECYPASITMAKKRRDEALSFYKVKEEER